MELSHETVNLNKEEFANFINCFDYYSESTKTLTNKIFSLETELENSKKQYTWLLEQIKLSKQQKYGKKSESGVSGQLSLFDDLPEEKTEEPEKEEITYTRKKKSVGRKLDTSKLPREIVNHELSAAEKICECCKKELIKIGDDISEQIEYKQEECKVMEHHTAKYKCCDCKTIKSAKKPEQAMPKCMAAPSLVADVIVKKYDYHLPWYRQSQILSHKGIEIPANTLCNWFMQAGEVLEPLKNVLINQVINIHNLQADETPVIVLTKDKKAYMWCYHSLEKQNKFLLFMYGDGREKEHPNKVLEKYKGILQTDGYYGYNDLRDKEEITPIGCWAHARRKFFDVTKVTKTTGKAHEILKWITKLYKIEAKIKNISNEERKNIRQEESVPILEKIRSLLLTSSAPPKSVMGKAIYYALAQWKYLEKYVNYGEAEIDNNLAENHIRPFALGRKNWMFIGNEKAGKTAAFFYSLIQTCKMHKINTHKYLEYVIKQAPAMRRGEINPKILLPQFIDKHLLE